jgi:hypothetical protein
MSISTLVRPDAPVISDPLVTEDPVQAMVDAFLTGTLETAAVPDGATLDPPSSLEPASPQELADLARRAAREVEQRGWTRYKLTNVAGEVCAMGAVTFAIQADLVNGWDCSEASIRATQIVELLGVRFANWLGAHSGVPAWNDGHQKNPSRVPSPHSAAYVAAAFRGFADDLLAGNA